MQLEELNAPLLKPASPKHWWSGPRIRFVSAISMLVAIIFLAVFLHFYLSRNSGSNDSNNNDDTFVLPDLLTIRIHTFPLPWGCGTYQNASLWLSSYSQKYNDPDLLYFSCESCSPRCAQNLYVNPEVFGMGTMAMLPFGTVLTELSASIILRGNYCWTPNATPVQNGTTYAVIVNKDRVRALFAFQVLHVVLNGPLTIQFGVFYYDILNVVQAAPGADWDQVLHY